MWKQKEKRRRTGDINNKTLIQILTSRGKWERMKDYTIFKILNLTSHLTSLGFK